MPRMAKKNYDVEVLLGARVILNEDESAGWAYLVKWGGYGDHANSWQPATDLINCERLLDSFWDNVGRDNRDYFVGDKVAPKDKWITVLQLEQEKRLFANQKKRIKGSRSLSTTSPHLNVNEEPEETQRADDGEDAQVNDDLFGTSPPPDADPHFNEEQNPSPPATNAPATKKRKVRVESSSDEEPLAKTVPRKKTTHLNRKQSAGTVSQRPSNSQANIDRLGPTEVPAQSGGISTKQRIGQGALAPTKPKELLSKSKLPSRKESALSKLSFTKKPSRLLFDATAGPSTNPPIQEAQRGLMKPPATIRRPIDNSPSLPKRDPVRPPLLNTAMTSQGVGSPVIPESQSPLLSAADMFLEGITPLQLAAPIPEPHEEAAEEPVELIPTRPLTRPALPTRIPKPFKWHGGLRFGSRSQTETCKVQIDDVSFADGLSFATVFQGVQTIEVAHMYDFADFEESLITVCQLPSQTALLSFEGADDMALFSVTIAYMEEFQKIFLFPIMMNKQLVGQVAFMPNTLYLKSMIANKQSLSSSKTRGSESLVCAILCYTLSDKDHLKYQQKNKEASVKHLPKEDPVLSLDVAKEKRHKFWRITLHYAVRNLRFPTTLFKYLNDGTNRPYTIWTGQTGYLQPRGDVETQNLQTILDIAGIKKTGVNDSRFVFIHVSALDTIHKLVGCSERRGSKLWVYYYTYGTSFKVDPCLWGVHEIWPCGGIVTFTPTAIISDPIGVRNLIVKISRHPLWACYVLPVVLGAAAAEQCSEARNPLDLLSQNEMLTVQVILHAIEEGNIALLEAPPERWTLENDQRAEWTKNFTSLVPPKQSEALACAMAAFSEMQARMSESQPGPSDVNAYIMSQLSQDLSRMERHPAFIRSYRRYVVVQDEKDATCQHNDGLEWLTINKFDFQDDFFPKQDVGVPQATIEQSA